MNRPKVFVVCFGESGRRIGKHVNLYKQLESLIPVVVENPATITWLLRPSGQGRIILVSKLDDPLLSDALLLLRQSSKRRKTGVTGYFFLPAGNQSANIVANVNVRKSYAVLDSVRVVNLPDYEPDSSRPKWPMVWLDDKIDDSEKQIVWEILKNEQSDARRPKKRRW